ncbi:MAG: alpha-hydroxy-acid oxidizing protein [Thermoplasmata archaeon]|nr:MAG: alpha-hydroxy-acid oxidizing protein [Thermoplasmata archaeon]
MEQIEQKAKSGITGFRGLADEDMASMLDELILSPALPFEPQGQKEESKIDTEVIIGEGRDVRFPLLLSHPIFLDANPMAKVNKYVRIALAYGAGITKTPINIGEGILQEESRISKKFDGDMILQWSPLRIGLDSNAIGKAKALVIDLGHANQPNIYSQSEFLERIQGKDGLIGGEVLGPMRHLDIYSSDDIKKHVNLLREATGYDPPIIVKIPPAKVFEGTKAALKADADAVIIDTSLDPFSTPASINGTYGGSLLGSIPPAVKAFKTASAQKKGVKLLVTGGFRNGADVVKALALGVDACGLVESTTVAIGCDLCGECYDGNCEKGIATKDQALRAKFNWKIAGKQLDNYINATKNEIELLLNFLGVRDQKELNQDHIMALTYDAAAITGVKLVGYDRELPMWFH